MECICTCQQKTGERQKAHKVLSKNYVYRPAVVVEWFKSSTTMFAQVGN